MKTSDGSSRHLSSAQISTEIHQIDAESGRGSAAHEKIGATASIKPNASFRTWDEYEMGYPRFAAFIAEDKDKSSTIYRRFERLGARNLLYLESELAELEAEQDAMDKEYREESIERKATARSWKALRLQAPKTFYSINPTDGLSEILDAEEANGKDLSVPKIAPLGLSLMESNSGSDPITGTNEVTGNTEDDIRSRKRLLLAYRIRKLLKEYRKIT